MRTLRWKQVCCNLMHEITVWPQDNWFQKNSALHIDMQSGHAKWCQSIFSLTIDESIKAVLKSSFCSNLFLCLKLCAFHNLPRKSKSKILLRVPCPLLRLECRVLWYNWSNGAGSILQLYFFQQQKADGKPAFRNRFQLPLGPCEFSCSRNCSRGWRWDVHGTPTCSSRAQARPACNSIWAASSFKNAAQSSQTVASTLSSLPDFLLFLFFIHYPPLLPSWRVTEDYMFLINV